MLLRRLLVAVAAAGAVVLGFALARSLASPQLEPVPVIQLERDVPSAPSTPVRTTTPPSTQVTTPAPPQVTTPAPPQVTTPAPPLVTSPLEATPAPTQPPRPPVGQTPPPGDPDEDGDDEQDDD